MTISEKFSSDEEEHKMKPVGTSQIVDCNGGDLKLEESDITLHIPAGAIEEGKQVEISLGYKLEDANVPVSNELESRISPTVTCGPEGTVFIKDILLSFPHNAVNEGSWTFTLLVKKSSFCTWKRIGVDDKDTTLSVRHGRCFIRTNHFCTYRVERYMMRLLGVQKTLRLGLFGKMLVETYQLRVRIWNQCDEQFVLHEESTNNETQLGISQPMTVMHKDMDISIDELDDGWRVDGETTVTLDANLIWTSHPSHIFHLKINDASKQLQRARISILQGSRNCLRVTLPEIQVYKHLKVERHAASPIQQPIQVEHHAASPIQQPIQDQVRIETTTNVQVKEGNRPITAAQFTMHGNIGELHIVNYVNAGPKQDRYCASISHYHQQQIPDITESDYSLLTTVSTWWKEHGNINMLKVLLRKFMPKIKLLDLQSTDNVMDLFKLLEAPGELSKSKFEIIFEAIKLCSLKGVHRKIRDVLPSSFQSFNEMESNIFSTYQQKLIRFGSSLKKESIKTICDVTDIKEEVYQGDPWLLICELEDKEIIKENSLAGFIKLLRDNGMGNAAKILE